MRRDNRIRFFFWLMLLAWASCPAWGDLRADVETLAGGAKDRSAGTAGAARGADFLAGELARRTGEKVHRQSYPLVVPLVDACEARACVRGPNGFALASPGRVVPLSPLLPSGGQAAAISPALDAAEVFYAGQGSLEELRGHDLAHRFIALDVSSPPGAWRTAASLGAAAIIFLGDSHTLNMDLLNKSTTVPVGIPRFYCDDTDAVASFRAGKIGALRFNVRIRWREQFVDNILCLLPGKSGGASRDARWMDQLVVLQSRYDAASQVMTCAPGATQAMNAGVLLDLAEKIAAAPNHCSVLLAFTAGDEWNLRGSRALLDLLGRDQKDPARAVAFLESQNQAAAQRRAVAVGTQHGLAQILSGDGRAFFGTAIRAALENELLREASGVEESLQKARLNSAASRDVASPIAASSPVASFEAAKEDLLSALGFLHANTGFAPNSSQAASLKNAAAALLPTWNLEVSRLTRLQESLESWPRIRAEIDTRTPMLWLSLALTSGSERYGFFARSFFFREFDSTGPMSTFAQAFRRYQPPNDRIFQADSLENRFTLETFFPVPVAFSSDAALDRGLPAGAFATTQDASPFLDTPNDTVENIQWPRLAAQRKSLQTLLLGPDAAAGALTDPLFYGRAELPNLTAAQSVTLFERTLGETLPQVPAAGTLIGAEALFNDKPLGPPLAGTERMDWFLTDAGGNVTFQSALRTPGVHTLMQAFTFDANGLPTRALAANQSDVHGLSADFIPDSDRPLRAMLFDCRRLDAYGLFDPRSLDTLDNIDILDARRLDKADFSAIFSDPGFAALFFPPDIRWQLLISKGNVGNRMLLINADAAHPTGQGFATTDLAALGPLPFRNALDLDALNQRRQRDLEKFGVSNDIIRTLQAASEPERVAAIAAEKTHDYPALFAASDALWSLQSQVYETLIDTSNGIIKAVIFLLLALIPFSYFLERLLIGATNVYKQILWFGGIFLLMTAALAFHPAFRISSAPLMIPLAFFILILSSTVVYILWGKFEEEIARLQGAGAAAHSISLRRGAVFGAAIRLGLSNMRRRGMRTALTLVTLVLLTFTLLCFTSVRNVVQLTPRNIASESETPLGILLRQRGWRTLPPESLSLARGLAVTTAGRWWYASEKPEQPWALPVRRGVDSATFYAAAFVGLDAAEANFHGPVAAHLIPSDNTCLLPAKAADVLHVTAGDSVNILGHALTVAGVFSPNEFAALRQLTGDPLTPIDPAGELNAPALAPSSSAAAPEISYRFMSPDNIVLMPAALVRQLGGRLTSIMLRPAGASSAGIDKLAENLAQRSAFAITVSDGAHTRSLNAAASNSPQDFGDVLVPMLIAGVIVFNTMLGAVAERTKEIHVYTSVGLAPAHVGMLFLAEAAALGTLGVVAGYIFGQGFATILSWTHLLPGIALNYSSLSAVATMGVVLAIVMLSALWPARAASRVAAPSLQKDWKLPKPVGDVLSVDLPFTVNETAARGVCAFIEEFLTTANQGGNSRFTADHLHAFIEPTTSGPVRGLTARIWLTPYDLGVIQMMRLAIHPGESPHVFDVHLELTREAGNPATWRRLNRPFLTNIRKQFLLWRNVSPGLMAQYLARSERMFHK